MASEYHESDFDVSELAVGGDLLLQEQVSNHLSCVIGCNAPRHCLGSMPEYP